MHPKRRKYWYRYMICLTLGWLALLFVGGQPASAQDKSGTSTVKMRRKKKKVKKVNPNRTARPVRNKHRSAPSQPTNFSHKEQYRPPASKRNSGKVKNGYRRPRSLTNSGQVKDAHQPPPTFQQSGNVKDTYRPPKSIGNAEKVRVSDAHPSDAEEGKEESHLLFIDRLFNRHNGYFRRRERYLQNLSIQLSGYQGDALIRKKDIAPGGSHRDKTIGSFQGDTRIRKNRIAPGGSHRDKTVGSFKGLVVIPSRPAQRKSYEKVSSEHNQFTGHIRQLRPYQREKINENKAYYIGGHRGWLRVPTPKAQTRYHKKLASQIHQHPGDIRVKRRKPGENMHPSVHHLARVGKASYEQKERHRKRRIWFTHIFKSKEQPQHLKEKTRKPRYDSKETDIWYY